MALQRIRIWLLVALIIVAATAVRVYDLSADAPAFFAGGSQDFTTDGPYLTLFARNAVQYGSWDLFDYHHWPAFKVSLISAASYLMFKLNGVSLFSANLAGIILSIAGLTLFLIGLRKFLSDLGMVIAALLLGCNFLLWLYGRFPFSENALLLFSGLAFLSYSFWFDSAWGKVVTGLLIGLGALLGKSYGLLLMAGPLLAVLMESRGRWKNLVLLVSPLIVLLVAFSALVLGDSGLLGFTWEHAAGVHGFPHGLESYRMFFENLIAYAMVGFHGYVPALSILCYLALVGYIVTSADRSRLDRMSLFMIAWIVAWILVLSPFNYRPIRYQFPLVIPMVSLVARMLSNSEGLSFGPLHKLHWWRWLLLTVLNWYALFNLYTGLFIHSTRGADFYAVVWPVLPFAVLLTVGLMILVRNRAVELPKRYSRVLVVAALVLTLVPDAVSYRHWFFARTKNLDEASRDVGQILGPTAVVSGQYGAALTANNSLRTFPYFVSRDLTDAVVLFSQNPVTHLAISKSDWRALADKYPRLALSPVVARYWLRDNVVYLVRVNTMFGNAQAMQYAPTDYERAVDSAFTPPDSMAVYLARFRSHVPRNKSGLVEYYLAEVQQKRLSECRPLVDSLTELYPTDFTLAILASVYYRARYEESKQPADQERSTRYLELAIRMNRENDNIVREMCEVYQPIQRILI